MRRAPLASAQAVRLASKAMIWRWRRALGGGAGESDPILTKAIPWAQAGSLPQDLGKPAGTEPLFRRAPGRSRSQERTLGADYAPTVIANGNLGLLLHKSPFWVRACRAGVADESFRIS